MDFQADLEGDEDFDSRQVCHPWTKGNPVLIDDLQISMSEAWDDEGKFFVVKEVRIDNDGSKIRQRQFETLYQDVQKRGTSRMINLQRFSPDYLYIVEELKMLCSLKHKNIVQYMGTDISTDTKTLSVFLKLMGQKSLLSIYKGYERGLSEMQVKCYTLHILNGLKYLHVDKKMVHGDIRCATIWVDEDGICKLTGFRQQEELITKLDRSNSAQTAIPWTAPEVFKEKQASGFHAHSDIWSLGCTVIEMASGLFPYGIDGEHAVLRKITNGETPPIPDALPEDGKEFVKLCLQIDYEKRPVVTDLLKHPFLREARRVIASTGQGSHSNIQGKKDLRTHSQPYPSNRITMSYVLCERASYHYSPESPEGNSEHQVAYGLTFTTKTGTDELQGSDIADPKRHFEVANNTINLINDLRKQLYQNRPAELVLHKSGDHIDTDSETILDAQRESEIPSGSSESNYPEGKTYSKEAFDEVYADISSRIENGTSNLYILDGEWMEQLPYEEKEQIQNQFEDSGYFETANTNEFVCFENIVSLSGFQFLPQLFVSSVEFTSSSNVPDPLLSHSHLGQMSSQSESGDAISSSTSNPVQTTSQAGSTITSSEHQGDSRKSEQFKISPSSKSTLDNPVTSENECGDACTSIKLRVSSSRQGTEPKTSVQGKATFLDFAPQKLKKALRTSLFKIRPPSTKPKISAYGALRCCVEEGNLCIILSFLRGKVMEGIDGTAVKSLAITLAVSVEGEPIQLTCMPMNNDTLLRVTEKGETAKDFYIPRHRHDISAEFSPTFSLSVPTLTPQVNFGSVTRKPSHEMQIVCTKGEELKLISLEKGNENACKDLEIPIHQMSTTLVLKRDLRNTCILEKTRELTCVQMGADRDPVKLIAKVPDLTTVDSNSKSFEIICCAELEISLVTAPDIYRSGEKVREGERQSRIVPFNEYFTMVMG